MAESETVSGRFIVTSPAEETRSESETERAREAPSYVAARILEEPKRERICSVCGQPGHNARSHQDGEYRPKVTRKAKEGTTPEEISTLAPVILGLTNTVVVTWSGPECGLIPQEQALLLPSLTRTLARMPAGAAKAISVWIDPFILLVGLGMWANRIATIKTAQNVRTVAQQTEDYRANGVVGYEYSQPLENLREQLEPNTVVSSSGSTTANGIPESIRESFEYSDSQQAQPPTSRNRDDKGRFTGNG